MTNNEKNAADRHIALLGRTATDLVSGFSGVISTMSFDLYGCVQAVVVPPVQTDGTRPDSQWFDVARLKLSTKAPVMPVPDFSRGYIAEGKKGAAEKPINHQRI